MGHLQILFSRSFHRKVKRNALMGEEKERIHRAIRQFRTGFRKTWELADSEPLINPRI